MGNQTLKPEHAQAPEEKNQGCCDGTQASTAAELQSAREALKQSEAKLANIIQSAMSAIITVDDQQNIVMFNPAAERMFGLPAAEALGRNLDQLIPVRFRADHAQQLRAFGETSQTQRHIKEMDSLYGLRADGTEFPADISISQTEVKGRKLFTAIVRDITERKKAEEALRLSEERLRALVTASSDVVYRMSPDWSELQPFDGRGFVADTTAPSKNWLQTYIHTDDQKLVTQTIQNAIRNKSVFELEHRVRKADGSLGWTFSRAVPRLDAKGEVLDWIGMASDVTRRRHAEEELRRKADDLARSNQDLEQFAYVASHDLQEPLRMVSAYTQLLGERYRGRLDDKADLYIGYAVEGAARMQALIQDLLAFSRVGRRAQERKIVDCSGVLDEVKTNLHAAVAECGAVLDVGKLPPVFADRSQMVQLFQNLIGNALKFRGERSPVISVSVEKQRNEWVFAVADNGIGIAPEHRDRIFEIFQRLHSRAEYPGNGIGLSICKKIVAQNGGRIWAESEVGKGSTFKFSLPVTHFVSQSSEGSKHVHAGA